MASDQPVEYRAPWCGPCRMPAPVLTEPAGQHADRWRAVRRLAGAPTMIRYRDGPAVASLVGARSKAVVWRAFEPYL